MYNFLLLLIHKAISPFFLNYQAQQRRACCAYFSFIQIADLIAGFKIIQYFDRHFQLPYLDNQIGDIIIFATPFIANEFYFTEERIAETYIKYNKLTNNKRNLIKLILVLMVLLPFGTALFYTIAGSD